jgi:hypothetical protein
MMPGNISSLILQIISTVYSRKRLRSRFTLVSPKKQPTGVPNVFCCTDDKNKFRFNYN